MPKIAMSKIEEGEMVEEYQSCGIDAVQALRKFLTNPNKNNFDLVEDCLRAVMSKSASVKKYCERKSSGQFELEI